jgi:hypothetical protein
MKTFKQALEKRVVGGAKTDKHTVFFVAKRVIEDLFGLAGKVNITVSDWKKGDLVLVSDKSIWRTELILNRNQIIQLINYECGGRAVSNVKVKQYYVERN